MGKEENNPGAGNTLISGWEMLSKGLWEMLCEQKIGLLKDEVMDVVWSHPASPGHPQLQSHTGQRPA